MLESETSASGIRVVSDSAADEVPTAPDRFDQSKQNKQTIYTYKYIYI